MKAISYSEVLAMVCDGLGWDPDNLDAYEFAQAKRAISAAIQQVYQYCFWPDLTRTEQRTFHPDYDDGEAVQAEDVRYYPPTDSYYIALRETTGNEPATKNSDTWETNLAYWALAQRTLSADEYDATQGYAIGDVVYDTITYSFYQCHTAAAVGVGPTDAASWGVVDELDPVVPWTRVGLSPIGRVEGVYQQDPRIHRGAFRLPWDETNVGIQVRDESENNPWIRFQLRPPRFTGTTFDEDAAYTQVSEEDAVTTGGDAETITPTATLIQWASSESYQVLEATYNNAGHVISANVLWPDGSTGVLTATEYSDAHKAIDAFSITHQMTSRRVVQSRITRDRKGNTTIKPPLTVEQE
jgi:hypothetical protein